MLKKMTLDQFVTLSATTSRVVVSREIYADTLTPISVFQNMATGKSDAVLLDSSDYAISADACIYIGLDPVAEFRSLGSDITISTADGQEQQQGDVLEALRAFYKRFQSASLTSLAKFAGGMIGFLSYDAVRIFEDIPERHNNTDKIPDACFKFYSTHIVFDKRSGVATIAKLIDVGADSEQSYHQGMAAVDAVISDMLSGNNATTKQSKQNNNEASDVTLDIDDAGFMSIVEKAKKYIEQGDAFQIVTSRQFQRPFLGDDFDIYRALRVLNPSPYQFYIRNNDFTIVGASPERLVSLQQGIVETMPIAGTRPRGQTREQDLELAQDLKTDEKELAEHMMLVDLGRNDIGAICEPGSVEVAELAKVELYSRVMHMVSRVQGHIQNGYDCFDVIRAGFPAGTLSGAPKIRAMEIIDELETSRRGVYGGSIVTIDNEGQMDSCITIRTAFVKNGIASVRAGAGVVLDSDPQKEADETRHKARAVLEAITLAEQGLV